MPELPKPIQEILSQYGFSSESIQKFKFGGIVGKVALVSLFGFGATAASIHWVLGPWLQIACLLIIPAATLTIIKWILNYAEKHPQSATLEGAEIIVWQQQQIMAAAKGLPNPASTAPEIPDPLHPQPTLLETTEEEPEQQ